MKADIGRERWLMEGAYNKVYRARDRVPREEFAFLLEKLMGTVRYVCCLPHGFHRIATIPPALANTWSYAF